MIEIFDIDIASIPNISSSDRSLCQLIQDDLCQIKELRVFPFDLNKSANRTVFTYIGKWHNIIEATKILYKHVAVHVDMTKHQGIHPRVGAIDVCPFVLLRNESEPYLTFYQQEINRLAKFLSQTYNLTIFFYGIMAKNKAQFDLSYIRKGQYEAMERRLKQGMLIPDYGRDLNHKLGASILGIRQIMLAYNISLNTKDVAIAQEIAKKIRGSGYIDEGEKKTGLFPHVKAIGWYMEDFESAQVSMNLMNILTYSLHEVYEAVEAMASELKVKVLGSELIGAMPYEVLWQSALYFSRKSNFSSNNELELINFAVHHLKLDKIKAFDVKTHTYKLSDYDF
ncbi:MAG: glutamate formimidoyltransferase [Chitinophagales bacterium]|nr:glutamate formimidoyltransferase [Chitinophagales bacterium]